MEAKDRTEIVFPEVKKSLTTWMADGLLFEVTALDRSDKALMVDLRVSRRGTVWLDDRIWLVNPPLMVEDSKPKVYLEYSRPDRPHDDFALFTQEQYRELLQVDRQLYVPTGRVVERPDKVVDPVAATKESLLDVFRIVTKNGPRLERIGAHTFKGDTLAARASTTDGTVNSNNASYATMCTGSGLAAATGATAVFTKWHKFFDYNGRMYFVEWDTSSLGSSAIISAAVYTLYAQGTGENDSNGYNLEVRYKDWGGTVTTADWFDPRSGGWNGLVSGGVLDVGTWVQTSGTANSLSDSGVYSSISLTGNTRVVIGLSGMNSTTAPTGVNSIDCYSADQAGTSNDPLLTITCTYPTLHNFLPILGVS